MMKKGLCILTLSLFSLPIFGQSQSGISCRADTVEIVDSLQTRFAIKTNLLFDVATVLNIEAEFPIKNRSSILAEWNFPWWVAKNNGSALEVLSGSLEYRYWFGNRTIRPKLTGWFAGAYAGGGLYDLQWNNNGYQGEFFISAGLSGGYAHTINKKETLRMEYSLGVGYLETDYRYYEGRRDNKYLVWQYDGRQWWLGPTKAKISLVWMIQKNQNKRRGGRQCED